MSQAKNSNGLGWTRWLLLSNARPLRLTTRFKTEFSFIKYSAKLQRLSHTTENTGLNSSAIISLNALNVLSFTRQPLVCALGFWLDVWINIWILSIIAVPLSTMTTRHQHIMLEFGSLVCVFRTLSMFKITDWRESFGFFCVKHVDYQNDSSTISLT